MSAFPPHPDCPLPEVVPIPNDLIRDCAVPLAPEPLFEALIFPPIPPIPPFGCPKIEMRSKTVRNKNRFIELKPTFHAGDDDKDNCSPILRFELRDPCLLGENLFSEKVTYGQPLQVTGRGTYTDGSEYLQVNRPAEDSVEAFDIVFPVDYINASPLLNFGCVHEGYDLIYVDYDGEDPAPGDSMGTQADSFKFKKDNTGFTAVVVDTVEKKVWVRPKTGGGDGGAFSLAQAITDGMGGTVTVRAIQHLVNLSASPNFEQTGDPLIVKYFKL